MAGWDDPGLAAWTTFGPPYLSEDEERALAGSPFTYWRERRISQGVAADDRCRRDRIPHRPGRAPGDMRGRGARRVPFTWGGPSGRTLRPRRLPGAGRM